MNPRIESITSKKIVGKRLTMSFSNYKISELWKSFLPHRNEIRNTISIDLISLVNYTTNHFIAFSPNNEFERWAAVEVGRFGDIPLNMETLVIEAGLYAVFEYKGLSTDPSIFQYIYGTWLPSSNYILDDRPHFEVLGEKYKNNDPNSEEEIWIPVKPK